MIFFWCTAVRILLYRDVHVSRIQTVDCTFNSCSDRISNVLVCRWTEYSTNIYLGDMNPTELADFGEDEGDAKCHATRATYTTTSSYVSRQSNSHSTYRTSSPRSRLLAMFKDPPMHVDPPHPRTCFVCIKCEWRLILERVSMERP